MSKQKSNVKYRKKEGNTLLKYTAKTLPPFVALSSRGFVITWLYDGIPGIHD